MKRVLFVADAREELIFEVGYYNAERAQLGTQFAHAVEDAVARALAFPQTGTRASRSTRRVFVKGFPFSIVYKQDADGIVVFAVAHHRRRPNYWRSRIQEP